MNSGFFTVAQNVVDRFAFAQKPAHLTYKSLHRVKNELLFFAIRHLDYRPRTISASGQDLWVIDTLNGKRQGYFLDLGAGDGFSGSNTYVLEKYYDWKGLCIEPNSILFEVMTKKFERQCGCVPALVDGAIADVDYAITGQDSGIIDADTDINPRVRGRQIDALRQQGRVKTMRTKTLAEVLADHSAPGTIDYFSFDVEGAETRILRNFPFDRYRFLTLTIERPTPELNALLFRNGYHFVRNALYDSFYVHESIPFFSQISRAPVKQFPAKAF